ncbi:hypothetical protein Y1Q_0023808 [Alligator mississippiensis]|uniref:Uncharacterized protein n=1 Tax=Alligator mississippiensis TaxID=8496 RepID=A0A151MKA2_ALLMI|nr:hypothetical protein Y1Q_0023808 [Alligator mississippiensis]
MVGRPRVLVFLLENSGVLQTCRSQALSNCVSSREFDCRPMGTTNANKTFLTVLPFPLKGLGHIARLGSKILAELFLKVLETDEGEERREGVWY